MEHTRGLKTRGNNRKLKEIKRSTMRQTRVHGDSYADVETATFLKNYDQIKTRTIQGGNLLGLRPEVYSTTTTNRKMQNETLIIR